MVFCKAEDGLLEGGLGELGEHGVLESEKVVMKKVILDQGRVGGRLLSAGYFLSSMRKVVPRPGSELFT